MSKKQRFSAKMAQKIKFLLKAQKINMITFIVKNHTIIVSGCKGKVEPDRVEKLAVDKWMEIDCKESDGVV